MQSGVPVSATGRHAVVAALRQLGPSTRHTLVEHTGLSRATVSATLQALLTEGRIRQRGTVVQSGRGRPAALVELNPSRADVVGLELGRGHVAVAVADAADSVVAQESMDVPVQDNIASHAVAAVDLLYRIAKEHGVDLAGVRAAAVGTPGPKFRGGAHGTPDLALARYERDRAEVAVVVAGKLACPVETDNNTRYTVLGEAHSGAAAGAADVIYIRVDEGVGGGVIADGALLSGHWGAAGEIGHVSVDPDGERCPCGGRGCVELVASLPALLSASGTDTVADLSAAIRNGAHSSALRAAASAVAQALAAVTTSVNSSVVVLGGRVARLPGFCALVEDQLRDRVPSWCSAELTVREAVADRTAGAIGGLVRARTVADSRAIRQRLLPGITKPIG